MTYKIEWKQGALRDLSNLSIPVALSLIQKIETYLSEAPERLGKSLVGKWKSYYRYRYGDYRVIYKIDKANNTVIVFHIGHRSDIY